MRGATRLVVVHRWGARPDDAFYPWLRRELERQRPRAYDEVRVPAFPSPNAPTIGEWVATLGDVVGRPTKALERTTLAGHSVGCQAILRWLATLPAGAHVSRALLVAPWWSVDAPWPAIRPWIDSPFDVARARSAALSIDALFGTGDPFVADQEASAALFRERLAARTAIVEGAGHFDGEREPAVLDALLDGLSPAR